MVRPGAATLIFVIGIFPAVAPALPHDCTRARSLMALCGSALSCAILPAAGREPLDVQEDALEVRIRAEGLAGLVAELRQDPKRRAHDAGRPGSRRRPPADRKDMAKRLEIEDLCVEFYSSHVRRFC